MNSPSFSRIVFALVPLRAPLLLRVTKYLTRHSITRYLRSLAPLIQRYAHFTHSLHSLACSLTSLTLSWHSDTRKYMFTLQMRSTGSIAFVVIIRNTPRGHPNPIKNEKKHHFPSFPLGNNSLPLQIRSIWYLNMDQVQVRRIHAVCICLKLTKNN